MLANLVPRQVVCEDSHVTVGLSFTFRGISARPKLK